MSRNDITYYGMISPLGTSVGTKMGVDRHLYRHLILIERMREQNMFRNPFNEPPGLLRTRFLGRVKGNTFTMTQGVRGYLYSQLAW
jgi:hypothetical protein